MTDHSPDCDTRDVNLEGIVKPCNCPAGQSLAPATCSPSTRTVTLTLAEHTLLVRTIRQRSYDMRLLANQSEDCDFIRKALDSAERLEARANELANDPAHRPGANTPTQ